MEAGGKQRSEIPTVPPASRLVPCLFVFLSVAFGGCAERQRPDFSLLYSRRAEVVARPPLIVIPGVMGTRLVRRSDGVERWPGSLAALATGRSFRSLAEPASSAGEDELVPGEIFDELGGRSFYADLVHALERVGQYECVPLEAIDAGTNCVLFGWDWRRDVVDGAARLDDVVEALRRARRDPELRVDVIAHSAGGLLARYYASFGRRDVLGSDEPVAPDPEGHGIDRLILIGTPNFGSIVAVQQSMFGRRFALGRAGPEVLATFAGLPQLFPHPDLDWIITADGATARLDLFSIATWRDHHVGLFSPEARERLRRRFASEEAFANHFHELEAAFERALVRGERFQRRLAIPLVATRARFFVFGSGCSATAARCLVEREAGALVLRGRPEEIRHPLPGIDYRSRMLEPGDGSVTKSSLLGLPSLVGGRSGAPVFPVAGAVFVCAPHESLPSSPTFLDNLFHVLLYRAETNLEPAFPGGRS
jgi:pimeloyl-ACP methyl ester carboxylesterase